MALDSPKKPFSKRFVWEDAPENLRHFVLDTAVEMGFGPSLPKRASRCTLRTRCWGSMSGGEGQSGPRKMVA
jgi:hypothetical protein